jgi:hypothetical protein
MTGFYIYNLLDTIYICPADSDSCGRSDITNDDDNKGSESDGEETFDNSENQLQVTF